MLSGSLLSKVELSSSKKWRLGLGLLAACAALALIAMLSSESGEAMDLASSRNLQSSRVDYNLMLVTGCRTGSDVRDGGLHFCIDGRCRRVNEAGRDFKRGDFDWIRVNDLPVAKNGKYAYLCANSDDAWQGSLAQVRALTGSKKWYGVDQPKVTLSMQGSDKIGGSKAYECAQFRIRSDYFDFVRYTSKPSYCCVAAEDEV